MTERFRQCLADKGIEFGGFERDGSYQTTLAPGGGDTNEIVSECVTSSGQDAIGLLRDLMAVNPDNLDIATIMAECLVRKGAVEPGYGADDYTADSQDRFADPLTMPTELQQALAECSDDPLGLQGGQ